MNAPTSHGPALRRSDPAAVATLLVANAVPLVGVLLLGWDLLALVRVYWLENGIVGIVGALRIATASGPLIGPGAAPGTTGADLTAAAAGGGAAPRAVPGAAAARLLEGRGALLARLVLVPFFLAHYGVFWTVHGVFVWAALPALVGVEDAGTGAGSLALVALVVAISHGVSFATNWLGRGEWRTASPLVETRAPYERVIVLHLTILGGAFAVALVGSPLWALAVMVAVKTAVDLGAHLRDRERAERRSAVRGG